MISDPATLPLRNVPVVNMRLALDDDVDPARVATEITNALTRNDIDDADNGGGGDVALAFRWQGLPLHARLHRLADGICRGLKTTIADGRPVILMMDGDAGKTLGGILRNELAVDNEIISIDGVQLKDLDYVDIGEIILPTEVVPLVIKSLLFSSPDMAAADGAAAHLTG
jgi:ethanolamine utilization protein EutA